MIESIAANSVLGHSLILGHYLKNVSVKHFPKFRVIKSQVADLYKEKERFSNSNSLEDQKIGLWPPKNKVDDPTLFYLAKSHSYYPF